MPTTATWNRPNFPTQGLDEPYGRYTGHPAGDVGADRAATLLGRLIFGGYFLYNGINHWKNRQMMSGYAKSKGVPAADVAVVGSGALIALGGLSLLLGVKPKVGSALIAAFLAGVTPTMHAFWKDQNPEEKMNDQINFMKNVALLGGASLAAAAVNDRSRSA